MKIASMVRSAEVEATSQLKESVCVYVCGASLELGNLPTTIVGHSQASDGKVD